jgi:hypothetical protein
MASTPKRPKRHSMAFDREMIALAKTMGLEAIVKRTGKKPQSVLKAAKRLGISLRSVYRPTK